jgi:hypothetical protein
LQTSFAYGKLSLGMNRHDDLVTTLTARLAALIEDQELLLNVTLLNEKEPQD